MEVREERAEEPRAAEPNPPAEPQPQASRRPYQKPAFRTEKIFETMALACGKISATQGHCRFNRKSS
jgi:hypothetical protein